MKDYIFEIPNSSESKTINDIYQSKDFLHYRFNIDLVFCKSIQQHTLYRFPSYFLHIIFSTCNK